MKKLIGVLIGVIVLTGCMGMDNTPTKKVEALLNKYQMNDKGVLDDLDNVLMGDDNLTVDEKKEYRDFMKKHYQDMKYEIKDESIDGNTATVEVEITVRNYTDTVNSANRYRMDHSDEFNEDNTFASYRLGMLKDVTETEKYTITFRLTKTNDEWEIDPLTDVEESKLNGLFGLDSSETTTETTVEPNEPGEMNTEETTQE